MAATTPNGSAISTIFRSSMRLTTPTVFIGAMNSYTRRDENRFFWTLSATTPYPVSSTASLASASACGVTASAIAVTMRSICSCVSSARIGWACFAARASVARLGDGCQILVGLRCGFLSGHESVAG